MIRTVLGDIEPKDLGVCYAHEHLIIDPSTHKYDSVHHQPRENIKNGNVHLPFLDDIGRHVYGQHTTYNLVVVHAAYSVMLCSVFFKFLSVIHRIFNGFKTKKGSGNSNFQNRKDTII